MLEKNAKLNSQKNEGMKNKRETEKNSRKMNRKYRKTAGSALGPVSSELAMRCSCAQQLKFQA